MEPELPLPPATVRPTDDLVGHTNKRYAITQKVLFVVFVFVALITGYLGPMEILDMSARGLRVFAQYVEKLTSEKKQVPKAPAITGTVHADHDMAADGFHAHRRRNPARQQWVEDVVEDEM